MGWTTSRRLTILCLLFTISSCPCNRSCISFFSAPVNHSLMGVVAFLASFSRVETSMVLQSFVSAGRRGTAGGGGGGGGGHGVEKLRDMLQLLHCSHCSHCSRTSSYASYLWTATARTGARLHAKKITTTTTSTGINLASPHLAVMLRQPGEQNRQAHRGDQRGRRCRARYWGIGVGVAYFRCCMNGRRLAVLMFSRSPLLP
jgi:hypothetical protein